ncbi:hypothetical protein Scep_024420 [Stephania cephalantha]|uniref:Uncharacterized protein n=1 Tax=Stephania cephalantha TaxID=152367 RepID=A0AAP0EWI7_9MAGN
MVVGTHGEYIAAKIQRLRITISIQVMREIGEQTAIGTMCGLAYQLGAQGNFGIVFVRLSKSHRNLYIERQGELETYRGEISCRSRDRLWLIDPECNEFAALCLYNRYWNIMHLIITGVPDSMGFTYLKSFYFNLGDYRCGKTRQTLVLGTRKRLLNLDIMDEEYRKFYG